MPVSAPAVAAARAPATPSRFAVWRQLESAADRYASYGALGTGLLAFGALLAIL